VTQVKRNDTVWRSEELARQFLTGVRGAIPLADTQIAVMLQLDRPDKSANILAPVETQYRWLRRIGFVEVDCYFKHFELAVFGERRP